MTNNVGADKDIVTLPVNYRQLTWEERRDVRNKYVKLQRGECFWCGDSLDAEPRQELKEIPVDWDLFPENFLKYPVHLQHDHTTNMTEGAVHSLCNAIMWNYFRR